MPASAPSYFDSLELQSDSGTNNLRGILSSIELQSDTVGNGLRAYLNSIEFEGHVPEEDLSGSITPAGNLSIDYIVGGLDLSGSITPTGVLDIDFTHEITLTGSITPTGVMSSDMSTDVSVSGTITPSGSLDIDSSIELGLSGSITPSGVLDIDASTGLSLSGTVTPGGVLQVVYTDSQAPTPITDLHTAAVSTTVGYLAWTAPYDNPGPPPGGTVDHYEMRYMEGPSWTYDWATATVVAGLPSPHAPLTVETFNLTSLTPGTTYSVGVRAYDEVGQISPFDPSYVWEFSTPASPPPGGTILGGALVTPGIVGENSGTSGALGAVYLKKAR